MSIDKIPLSVYSSPHNIVGLVHYLDAYYTRWSKLQETNPRGNTMYRGMLMTPASRS